MNNIPTLSHNKQFLIYIGISNVAAALTLYPLLQTSPNFYSVGVQLTEGFSTVICANWLLSLSLGIGKILQQAMFGELRLLEVEHIMDKSRFAVINSLIALSMFSEDFILIPAILTLFLLFMKVFHWILNDRFDFVFQHATTPRSALFTKNSLVLLLLLYVDFHLAYTCVEYSLGNNPDVYFAFGFEFAVLFLDLMLIGFKVALNTWELKYLMENPGEDTMEEKGWYMKIVEIVHTGSSLVIQLFLLYTFLGPYRFPIYVFNDLLSNIFHLVKKIGEFRRLNRAMKELESKLQDATAEDLNNDNDLCSICRDDMTTDGVPRGSRLFPKKLHCGHIIHLGCLKGWFERSQVCPMCRAPVFPPTQGQRSNINNNNNPVVANAPPQVQQNQVFADSMNNNNNNNNQNGPQQIIPIIPQLQEAELPPFVRQRLEIMRDSRGPDHDVLAGTGIGNVTGVDIRPRHRDIPEDAIINDTQANDLIRETNNTQNLGETTTSSEQANSNNNSQELATQIPTNRNTLRLRKSTFIPKDWTLFKLTKSKGKQNEATGQGEITRGIVLNENGLEGELKIEQQDPAKSVESELGRLQRSE